MSDAQRPANGNSGAGEPADESSARPARNMADIARLFLDGARPTPPSRTGPQQRFSPQKPDPIPPQNEPPAPIQTPYVTSNVAHASPESASANVMLGLACATAGASTWE